MNTKKKSTEWPANAKLTKKLCEECVNEFVAHRNDAITCSAACRKQRSLRLKAERKCKYKAQEKDRKDAIAKSKYDLQDTIKYNRELRAKNQGNLPNATP